MGLIYSNMVWVMVGAVVVDLLIGDPRSHWHPVVVIGRVLAKIEKLLNKDKPGTKRGGVLLFVGLLFCFLLPYVLIEAWMRSFAPWLSTLLQIGVGGLLLSTRSLIEHGVAIAKACDENLAEGRKAAAHLAGRDTDKMNTEDCRRVAVESLSESLVDGVISPLFYLLLLGIPGMLIFKIVSTMDSMVGYKSDKYLSFGWFGARLDDVLNWIPARLTWLLMVLVSWVHPALKGKKAWEVGLKYHHKIPGPNSGWSEMAAAGALNLQLAGPIYRNGVCVNEDWFGDKEATQTCSAQKVYLMVKIIIMVTALFCFIGVWA